MNDDEIFDPVRPDDPDEQLLYLRRLRWRYPDETASVTEEQLGTLVRTYLKNCPLLKIEHPNDVVRFLALGLLITPEQRKSALLSTVTQRVLTASDIWSAAKRLDFIYTHVVGRPVPNPEPDFGRWFVDHDG